MKIQYAYYFVIGLLVLTIFGTLGYIFKDSIGLNSDTNNQILSTENLKELDNTNINTEIPTDNFSMKDTKIYKQLKNDIKKILTSSGYTFIDLGIPLPGEEKPGNKEGTTNCENDIKDIINLSIRTSENNLRFGGYKDLVCNKLSERMNIFSAQIDVVDGILEGTGYTTQPINKKQISGTYYKTLDNRVVLLEGYTFIKNLGDNIYIFRKNNKPGMYTILDSSQGKYGLVHISDFHFNYDENNIAFFSSGGINEITVGQKDSSMSEQISFNTETAEIKKTNMTLTICEENGKCGDGLADIVKNLETKKDNYGGSIIGNIVPGKIQKVIVTPIKNDECPLDLEPYELSKFDSKSGEFKYNFSLKWKNVCEKSGARFIIQLVTKEKTYEVKTYVKGVFYDENIKNMKFVAQKQENFTFDPSDKLGKYLGYLQYEKIKKYVYLFVLLEPGEPEYYFTSDKKMDKKDFPNTADINFLPELVRLYQENLLSDIKLLNENVTLDYNNFQTFDDGKDITFQLDDYNSSYKKIELLGYKDVYEKNENFYVKGRDKMIPVRIKLNNEYQYKIDNKKIEEKDFLFLSSKVINNYVLKIKENKKLSKLGKVSDVTVYEDKTTGCMYIPLKESSDYGVKYDYSSLNTKIHFGDGKDYGDYTFRLAGQAGEDTYSMGLQGICYHIISQKDLEPEKRLMEFGDYVGFPIYKYKSNNDAYLQRRYREQYGVERGSESGERYETFVKTLPVVYWKDPFGRWLRVVNSVYMPQAEKAKPVIYLYPETTQKINVQVEPNGGFKVTIPQYPQGGWDVVSTPDSQITFEGEIYPYLFWEGKALGYEMGKKGFVIKNNSKEIEKFLVEKLTQLGLNTKEIKDFNEFWIEKLLLVKNPYIFITFASKEQQDLDSPLSIMPKPQSIIRVFMDYRGLDTYEKVEELKIITPKREGFTVVEWGGAKGW